MHSRIFLIHGWTGRNDKDWFPWAIDQLRRQHYQVYAPLLPDTDHPIITAWVNTISQLVDTPRPSDIFIGHSLGCQAILRYLATQPDNTHVDKVILVAGAQLLSPAALPLKEDEVIFKPWRDTPINFAKVRHSANKFIAIFSLDDPWVIFADNHKIYQQELGAKIVVQNNQGHFTQEDGVTQLPALLKFLD